MFNVKLKLEDILNSKFFDMAKDEAGVYVYSRGKTRGLLRKVIMKMSSIASKDIRIKHMLEKIIVLMDLVRAYSKGQYKDIPIEKIILVIAAIIYFILPTDFIPDIIPIMGLIDDATVIAFVFKTVDNELQRFSKWEKGEIS